MRDRLLHSLSDRLRKADQGDLMCVIEQEALLGAVQLLAMVVDAMHLAGYRHAVGTLWSVPDPVTGGLVKDFHHRSSSDGRFRPDTSARALHGAVQSPRHRFPGNPSRWAPLVHIGP